MILLFILRVGPTNSNDVQHRIAFIHHPTYTLHSISMSLDFLLGSPANQIFSCNLCSQLAILIIYQYTECHPGLQGARYHHCHKIIVITSPVHLSLPSCTITNGSLSGWIVIDLLPITVQFSTTLEESKNTYIKISTISTINSGI